MANKPFKMKGSPMKRNFGIGADSPMKETIMPSYKGVKIDPSRSYKYKSAKIPSFRDMVSLEQQQAYAKKVDERRAGRKEDKQSARDAQTEYDRKVASGEITPGGPGEISQFEQQRKVLESQRQMEEEGRRLSPDPLGPDAITLQPLTLPEIKEKKKKVKKKSTTKKKKKRKGLFGLDWYENIT